MNVGALLMLFLVAVAAVIGIIYITHAGPTTPVDTFDRASSPNANATHELETNLTATGTQVGGGVILLIAGIFVILIIALLAALALGKL